MRTSQAVFAGILWIAGTAWAQDPPSRVARLSLIDGEVSFQPANADDWSAATLNYPLTTGDHLYADRSSRAEMRIGPNAVRLGAETNFGYLNLNDDTVQMRFTEGSLHIRIRSLSDTDVWEIDTPNGAISLLRTGEYRIDTDPQRNATMVTVRSGQVEVTANRQSFSVRRGQTAYFTGDETQEEIKDANPVDGFDALWEDRDRLEDSAPAPRYVSRSMVGYEDLDANGTWSDVPEYGPVWHPRVAAGWAPYHYGHWAWVAPWGWTWIDDASWGFAPFHYGRWAYVGGGWGWCPGPIVPRPVYAPALVVFVGGGPAGIGWFPLGPREAYVPAYRRTNVTIVNNVYINRSVPGAFSAVSERDFAGAHPVHRAGIAVPPNMIASAPAVGFTAPVAPQRASLFGRPQGQIGSVARPPTDVFNRVVIARTSPPPGQVGRPPVRVTAQSPAGTGFGRGARQTPPPTPSTNGFSGFGRNSNNAPQQQDRMGSRPPAAQPRTQQPETNAQREPERNSNSNSFGRSAARPQSQPQPQTQPSTVARPNGDTGFGRQSRPAQSEPRPQRTEQRREERPGPRQESNKTGEKPNH